MSFPISNTSVPSLFTTPVDGGVKPLSPLQQNDEPGFADMLGHAFNKVNETQINADTTVQKMAAGEPMEIHQVMLQMEQARLSLMMAVEVRNKSVEAYQEISRMPM